MERIGVLALTTRLFRRTTLRGNEKPAAAVPTFASNILPDVASG